MRQVNQSLFTDGSGYWSDVAKEVKITHIDVPYVDDEGEFGELHVYFDTKTWDCNDNGLIYTDRQFIKELRSLLTNMGLAGDDVDYSEQGMQGSNYVSLDIGEEFLKSYNVVQLEQLI